MLKGNHNTFDKTDFARIQRVLISFKVCIALKKLTEEKVFKGSFEENTVNTEDDTVDSFIPTMNLN